MGKASRDGNYVPTITGLLNTDGETVTAIKADPTNHSLDVSNSSTGVNEGGDHALRDANMVPSLIAASSADGRTPVALYANSTGQLLVDSN